MRLWSWGYGCVVAFLPRGSEGDQETYLLWVFLGADCTLRELMVVWGEISLGDSDKPKGALCQYEVWTFT